VPLTRGYTAIIDAADADMIGAFNWNAQVTVSGKVYAARSGRVGEGVPCVLMHRVLAGAVKGQDVDHIDTDGLNNRRSNLRACTHHQNMATQQVSIRSKTGLKGAYPARGKFAASIEIDGRTRHLGTFETAAEAAAAYRGAARLVHGDFAWGEAKN